MQAKCKCQPGSISILAGSWALPGPGRLGELLCLSCGRVRVPSCWWDREGFQGPSWGWGRKPQIKMGKGKGEECAPGLCWEKFEGYPWWCKDTRPLQKWRKGLVQLFHYWNYHCICVAVPFPGSEVWDPLRLPAAGRDVTKKSQGHQTKLWALCLRTGSPSVCPVLSAGAVGLCCSFHGPTWCRAVAREAFPELFPSQNLPLLFSSHA